jgi:hypothetical protein
MPRLNIEECFWSDPRYYNLIEAVQQTSGKTLLESKAIATGWMVLVWQTAQRYWTDKQFPKGPIPRAIWERNRYPDAIIECDLAYRTPEGDVCVRGVESAFEWLGVARENGQRGGRPKKSNDLERDRNLTKPSVTLSNLLPLPLPLPLKDPYISKIDTKKDVADSVCTESKPPTEPVLLDPAPAGRKRPAAKKAEGPTPGSQVWEAYVAAMQQGWNCTPPRSAKTAAQAKQLVDLVGLELALKIAAYYPTRRSQFYVQRGHPFGLIISDHMSLLREVSAGVKLTKGVVNEMVQREETENACMYEQFRKETNPLLMNDEEFAEWKATQAALEAKETPQTPEITDGLQRD